MNIFPVAKSRLCGMKIESFALMKLTGPILTAHLAQQALAFTDTVMAGRVGATDLAGVAVGASLWIPVSLFIYGVLLAVTPMVAQMHGAGRTTETGPLVRRGLWVALPMVVMAMLMLRHAGGVFVLMEVIPQVASIASNYLKAIAWGLPAAAVFFLLRNLSEGMGLARPSMLIGLASLPINVAANFVFIYGKLGFPALGGVGCGWASTLTLWFMCGCMCATILWGRGYAVTHCFDFRRSCGEEGAMHILRLGFPIGCSLLVESSVFALIALFLAPLGASVVASHQITLNYSATVFMIPLSVSSAITIRVGHAVGSRARDLARLTTRTGLLMNTVIAIMTAAFTVFFAEQIACLYTFDRQVIGMVVGLLYLNALYQVSDAFQVGAIAALRGYKDTRVPLLLILVAFWGIAMPLGYSLSLTSFWGAPMGAKGFWISLVVGLSISAVLLGGRLCRLQRGMARMENGGE
ncbi:sodium-driven efflux pump, MatE and MatE domain-containing [Syntrophotalea carbinolica DSM 2380]|uniref:Sodium-driven efflux pump, MatE and MatE domain-containing n=1 Tax=Syntrophotalea carbinolica (strain DSM 2380 / NBRC 103641 / GraBd1) TaxID=338963 RepID=Q3A2C1_SYNC1|nr:MATE family efflux transporter [Syntrophotalea carbinolica]ABA89486.1 sodium-driven efflux pump, MatE and MatE domain-containing [Syntrophotalea carbinolica DSM 2380]